MKKLTKEQEKTKRLIGRTIKKEATNQRLELLEMKELTSLSVQTISKLYTGRGISQIDTLIKVCDVLGLEIIIQKKGC